MNFHPLFGPPPLICISAAAVPAVPSRRDRCAECGWPVWVSRAMVPAVDAGETRPWCHDCAAVHVRRTGATPLALRHPAQQLSDETFAAMAAWTLATLRGEPPRKEGTP